MNQLKPVAVGFFSKPYLRLNTRAETLLFGVVYVYILSFIQVWTRYGSLYTTERIIITQSH
jgi:hypothetical protein